MVLREEAGGKRIVDQEGRRGQTTSSELLITPRGKMTQLSGRLATGRVS